MAWELYDYVNRQGINEIAEWTLSLQKLQRKKLKAKLNMVMQAGTDLPPQLLAGTGTPHIYKLKVQGNPKLRPLLCKGPIDNNIEFTLLIGAKEIQFGYEPADALMKAMNNREEIIKEPSRRALHERID